MGETFNSAHYSKVVKARRLLGLPVGNLNVEIAHRLVGKMLRDNTTGQVFVVEKAMKHWFYGWYVALLLNSEGSHRLIWWENINSSSDTVLESISRIRQEMEEL